jgi:hypothetical protein
MSRTVRVTFGILAGILLVTLIVGVGVSIYTSLAYTALGPARVVPGPEGQSPVPYYGHPGFWGPRFGFFGLIPCFGFLGILFLVFLLVRLVSPRRWGHWHGAWNRGPGHWEWHPDQPDQGNPPSGAGSTQSPPPAGT